LPWLFVTERDGQFTRQGVYYLVRRISERAGLARVHPHMLRHACGYALANKGHDLRTIQDYLGHRDPKHTAIYTRTAAKRFENLWH
jgi:type 1 fimbriae regulatory protein FimB/type 1 fimbriae regulatory protein FimE